MNHADTCLNVYRFLKSLDGKYPFPITLSKMAFLACADQLPRSTAKLSELMGVSQSACSITMEALREIGLVERQGGYATPYQSTDAGEELIRRFKRACMKQDVYEPRKKKAVRRNKAVSPATG